MDTRIVHFTLFVAVLQVASSLQCYRCHSSQPGCGKELNIRLQKWYTCPSLGTGSGENFCVKVIEKRGSEDHITRECLQTLRHNTGHREKLPTVQRHGYCTAARQDDPWAPIDERNIYCFCNDWNGCNSADTIKTRSIIISAITAFSLIVISRLM